MFSTTAKRVVAATFAGGIVALSPVVAPAANAAPLDCADYQGAISTTTTLTIDPSTGLAVGDVFSAIAEVTVAGTGLPAFPGTVTFTYAGDSQDAPVDPSGTASVEFDAVEGTNSVTATYQGVCPGGAADVLGSSASTVPVVAGVEAGGGGNGGTGTGNGGTGLGGVAGGSGGNVGGLASTGMDNQTELYALLGAGMVAVGGLTLVVRRRRVEA